MLRFGSGTLTDRQFARIARALASHDAFELSTTHVTSGGIFGIGLLQRHEADWSKVRDILLSWVATLPLGAVLVSIIYKLFLMQWA